jgi:hypothetical protein
LYDRIWSLLAIFCNTFVLTFSTTKELINHAGACRGQHGSNIEATTNYEE